MNKRRVAWFGVAAVGLLCLAVGILLLAAPRGESFMARFNRIEPGMTDADVEGLLGQPAALTGEYGQPKPWGSHATAFWTDSFGGDRTAYVRVNFDRDGKVVFKQTVPIRVREPLHRRLAKALGL
jgi:hypothetical protein